MLCWGLGNSLNIGSLTNESAAFNLIWSSTPLRCPDFLKFLSLCFNTLLSEVKLSFIFGCSILIHLKMDFSCFNFSLQFFKVLKIFLPFLFKLSLRKFKLLNSLIKLSLFHHSLLSSHLFLKKKTLVEWSTTSCSWFHKLMKFLFMINLVCLFHERSKISSCSLRLMYHLLIQILLRVLRLRSSWVNHCLDGLRMEMTSCCSLLHFWKLLLRFVSNFHSSEFSWKQILLCRIEVCCCSSFMVLIHFEGSLLPSVHIVGMSPEISFSCLESSPS